VQISTSPSLSIGQSDHPTAAQQHRKVDLWANCQRLKRRVRWGWSAADLDRRGTTESIPPPIQVDELEIELAFTEEQLVKQEHEEVNLLKTQNGSLKRLARKLKLVELQLQDDANNWKREEVEKI